MKKIIILFILLAASPAFALEVVLSGNVATVTFTAAEMNGLQKVSTDIAKSKENIIKEALLDRKNELRSVATDRKKSKMDPDEVDVYCETRACGE